MGGSLDFCAPKQVPFKITSPEARRARLDETLSPLSYWPTVPKTHRLRGKTDNRNKTVPTRHGVKYICSFVFESI